MRLSDIELRAMDSWWRKWGQEHVELPIFRRMGMQIRDRDVLEIGCGNGFGAYLLNREMPRSYVGLDVMEEQIRTAQRRYPQHEFLVQDATDLSGFDRASKDLVVIFGVLHHISAWRQVIEAIRDVLRPGGRLFVEEPLGRDVRLFDFFFRWGHPVSDFGIRRMEDYVRQQGFTIVKRRWTPLLTMVHARLDPG